MYTGEMGDYHIFWKISKYRHDTFLKWFVQLKHLKILSLSIHTNSKNRI